MSSRAFLQPFACVGVLFILHRLTAFIVISHNTAIYFEFTGTAYNPLFVSISYGVVRLISSLCMPLILTITTKRMGFISFGSASTLAMLGGIFSSFFGHWLSQAYPTQWQFMLIWSTQLYQILNGSRICHGCHYWQHVLWPFVIVPFSPALWSCKMKFFPRKSGASAYLYLLQQASDIVTTSGSGIGQKIITRR